MENLIVTDTSLEQKEICQFSRGVTRREERSIINYVLLKNDNRRETVDTRIRRGPEIVIAS